MARRRSHSISGAFVFLLLGMFAVLSMALVLVGAQAYRTTVDQTAGHTRDRILQAFVRNAARADDENGVIAISEIGGVPVLCFASELDGERYIKYVYCHNGELRELFTSAGYGFDPDEGEKICEAEALELGLEDGLLTATLTGADGTRYTIYIGLRCAG